ncbi:glycosyltransferase family 2 protein [Ideonella sp. YS5]|uniref:glycosyltransferase family 2 protein n=1 Tax=Ideonella sp. YS5 TaxID=3453714 RepID=UPI003EEBBDFA
MSLSFFRSSSPGIPAASAPAVATAGEAPTRLVIERIEGLTVVGWAARPGGACAEVVLLVDGQPVAARVDRMHRQDVLDALQASGDTPLGFRLHLPGEVWRRAGAAPAHVELRADTLQVPVALPASIEVLVEALRHGRDGDWEDRFVELALQVRQLGAQADLKADLRDWLEAQVRLRGGWAVLDALASHAGVAPLGHVERVDRGVLQGWACLDFLDDEAIGLSCNGEPVDCSVIRVERADVQRALNSARQRLGFEIELPATLWQRAGESGELALSVWVAGRPLGAAPWVLRRETLRAWLDQQREVEASAPAEETADQRRERQYATLLLVEHVSAAGLWDGLDQAQRRFVREQAQRYGVGALLADAPADEPAADPVVDGAATDDYATTVVWRLLRDFNARVNQDPAQPEAALQAVLADGRATGTVGQRLLWSVIPYFCSLGRYAALRPSLDAGRLRQLVRTESAWELSLLLPEAAASGDFRLARLAMKKIAAGRAGWLNTDCVAFAVRAALASHESVPRQATAVSAFLHGFLDLLAHLASVGYWSRLHDANLLQGLAAVLANAGAVDDTLQSHAEWLALRACALVPDFWRALDGVEEPVGGWPPALQRARAGFEQLRQALARPEEVDVTALTALVEPFAWLRSLENVDADLVARELAMALASRATTSVAAQATAVLLHESNDLLRLAASPGAAPGVLSPQRMAGLADDIRALAEVAAAPQRAVAADLIARCLADRTGAVPLNPAAVRAVRALGRRRSHFLGVRLAAADWLRCRDTLAAPQREAALVALRELWIEAFDACSDMPHPPAALISAFSLLDGALADRPDGVLARVVAEWRQRLQQRYGERVSCSEGRHCAQPSLAVSGPAYSTLVAIYSCRRNLPTRVQAIRDSWGRDLDALGIPWIVVVGDGAGELNGDVLELAVSDAYEALPAKTLALVDWAWRHTRFEHLLKIDDDCHLSVAAYFAAAPYLAHHYHGRRLHRGIGGTDRVWHQNRSSTERAAHSADKSPEPSLYADGGAAYCLSRHAMAQVVQALQTTAGARLVRSSFLEDKLLGDLLALRGIDLSNEGHYSLVRRRFGPGAIPVNAFENLFYPSRYSPTLVSHLDGHEDLPAVQAGQAGDRLLPPRVWPTHGPVRLGGSGTNQLELVSAPSPDSRLEILATAPVVLIAVARNERVLAPHFLAHYRSLGVQAFVFIDNLSDDGTREFLAAQPDVVLYSADTEYRHSHYGVSWQQAVLGAHALGKWVVLADLDEFLVYPDCEQRPIGAWLDELEAAGHDAARVMMVDMYPAGDMDQADFSLQAPFEAAPCFDREPLVHWALGSGSYSNAPTYLSALRHRLIPDSAPNLYTSQKIAVFRYAPWVRLAEGLHYASNLRPAPEPVWFAHFKYHAGFRRKVHTEVARLQHFNGAEEYKKYAAMLAEARRSLHEPGTSAFYAGSRTWLNPR